MRSRADSASPSKPSPAERLHTATEIADRLGICKMTVLRYVASGRILRPKRFVRQGKQDAWLWDAAEFREAIRSARKKETPRHPSA
ncbi:MAG TPA: hypothetical protein VJP87_13410 [Candidatus Acidoferrales bacterium]|nr:hypothetical protein [Candidatus Acidoferrales bacterium]